VLTYKITAKYAKGPEKLIAKFDSMAEAKEYIQQKVENDILMKVAVSYLLYDTGELMGTFDQSNIEGSASAGARGSGQQPAARQSFSPSPLQTSLRPSGMPPSSFKDVADDKKK
jgi:hypothetical protein